MTAPITVAEIHRIPLRRRMRRTWRALVRFFLSSKGPL